MGMSGKDVPKLRFKGFTEDWEQRELASIGDFIIKSVNPQITPGDEFVEYSMPSFDNNQIPEIVLGSSMQSIRLKIFGEVLLTNKLNVRQKRIWLVTEPPESAVASSEFMPFTSDEINLSFLQQLLLSDSMTQELESISSGTSNSQKRITPSDFLNFKVFVPIDTEEQRAIGTFFSTLDNTITLHQRKLEKLKATKDAYLSEMFPAEGECKPKRRFAGFSDAWKRHKLGEIANIVRGASPRPIQEPKWFDVKSEIGWLRISDVTEQNGRIHHLEQRISKLGQEKTRVLTEPHLLLSIAATVGKPVINYVKTGVHDGFLIFLEPTFEREFMFQWLEMFRPNWQKYGQPGSQVNLNSDLVKIKKLRYLA